MSAAEHEIAIDGSRLTFIYDDDLVDLLDLNTGERAVPMRASDVESTPEGWFADLSSRAGRSPVGRGPILGPFRKRRDALTAEVAWLRERLGQL